MDFKISIFCVPKKTEKRRKQIYENFITLDNFPFTKSMQNFFETIGKLSTKRTVNEMRIPIKAKNR